jgi:hypothetical protein
MNPETMLTAANGRIHRPLEGRKPLFFEKLKTA